MVKKEIPKEEPEDSQAIEKVIGTATSFAVADNGVRSIVDNFYTHLRYEELTEHVKPFASSKTVSNMRLVILGPSDDRIDD
jgi:hypothetical protein